MAITITFPNSKGYVGTFQQPLADIVIIGPTGRFPITACLVDTGADFLQIPASAATKVGLLPSPTASSISIRTASGIISMTKLTGVTVEIEGTSVTTDILCHPSGTSRALIGRTALRALTNVGFNKTDWLW
jgi:predicted aspartyl protease